MNLSGFFGRLRNERVEPESIEMAPASALLPEHRIGRDTVLARHRGSVKPDARTLRHTASPSKLIFFQIDEGDARMTYVDGFVIPVPKSKVAEYKKMATWGKKVWMKHGALQYFECVGDDLAGMPECGNFKTMAGLKPTETAFFSFIIYKSKAHRDAVNKKVMEELQNQPMKSMPFDVKRMAFGGFKTLVQG
jgi:uncharacterized protein YbaA (DUF1428 family)